MGEQSVRERHDLRPVAAVLAALLLVLGCFALNSHAPPFSPDSWGYFELARSFATDPYAIGTWRSYSSAIPYSSAFPPLWPLLIAGVDRFTGLGIYSGYLLNAALFIAFVLVAEAGVRDAFGRRWLGAASALLLFAFPPFQTELLAARAIPLQLLLLAATLWAMTRRELSPLTRAVTLGLLAGLLLMTRFDALFLAGGLVLAAAFLARDWRALPIAALAALLPLMPWMLYSLATFGQPFATDNAQVALSVDPREFVTNFHVQPPPSLADAPLQWAWKLVLHLPALVAAVLLVAVNALPGTLLATSALRHSGRAGLSLRIRDGEWWRSPRGRLALLIVLTLLPVGAYLITGYFNERYFSATVWLSGLGALLVLTDNPRAGDPRMFGACAALAVLFSLKVTLAPMVREGWSWAAQPLVGLDADLRDARRFRPLLDCLDPARPRIAVLFADPTAAAHFGAISGHRAAMQPRNWSTLDADEVAEFLRRHEIGYALPDARLRFPAGMARAAPGACADQVELLDPTRAGT